MWLQIDIATMEISVNNSQKDKNKSTMTPSYTITWHTPKSLDILLSRYIMSSVSVSLLTIDRSKEGKCPSTQWITKSDTYTLWNSIQL